MEKDFSQLSDAELVTRSIDDADYFSGIIMRYEDKLGRYITRRAKVTREDVEDLLQDIFIRVYTHLHDFDTKLSFSSWIYRIAHNHVVSWYRKHHVRNRDRVGDIETELLHNIAGEFDIEHAQWTQEMRSVIAEQLSHLKDQYREVILLRFFEGKDYDEMSDILEIPPGTVATHLNRAKKQLQQLLANHI